MSEWKIVDEGNDNPPVCAVIKADDAIIIVDNRMRFLDPLPIAKRIVAAESKLTALRMKCEVMEKVLEEIAQGTSCSPGGCGSSIQAQEALRSVREIGEGK